MALLSAMAEDERERIVKRAADGRAAAKARNVKFGRPSALSDHQKRKELERLAEVGRTTAVAALWRIWAWANRPFHGCRRDERRGDVHRRRRTLRYTAASELRLAGCSDDLIAAATGPSLPMERHYTDRVRQRVRAREAQGKRP